ncbi:predicted protein [Chaetomium globosum CBS 148.51]|uniref:Uncharacterized protein n=1 Tax=Chaetomium globosum (strain ATCC 6205 / CBS 148.51 / DSM 1962 / NBRC 6347 / NRRL 1970) TaxID=306901 RepID=Q2GNG1_CHAGB|nr:uncharacterized protein CHGG_10493 [Chaetomium globosum CBS 148.51]EAQ84089.1 predicted protein [Chaetomium globosum CBS 148.51]
MGNGNLGVSGEQPDNQSGDREASDSPSGARLGPRHVYSLDVQRVAKLELENSSLLLKTFPGANWASLIEAAPAIVRIMGVLLKISRDEAAAGLKIASPGIRGEDGEVIGKLPHNSFHTELESSIHSGRSVLKEFQGTTTWVFKAADRCLVHGGNISIEMLQDDHDVVANLVPEIDEVWEFAEDCLKRIRRLSQHLESWCEKNSFLKDMAREAIEHAQELAMSDVESLCDQKVIAPQAELHQKPIGDTLYNFQKPLVDLNARASQLAQSFSVLVELFTRVEEDAKDVQQTVKQGAKLKNNDELELMAMSQAAKKRVITKAFHLQSHASAIRDITATFVEVSNKYIKPALSKLETFSFGTGVECKVENEEFMTWCDNATAEIRALAAETDANLRPNIQDRILSLQEYAIDVAFPRSEGEGDRKGV